MNNRYAVHNGDSGGGGFFLACEDFGRMFDNSFPACAFLFKWRLGRAGSVHSGSAS